MTGYGQLIANVTPADLVPHPTQPTKFLVVDKASGKYLGFNSDGKLYLSTDAGIDQAWDAGGNCLSNVNNFEGKTQYAFVEWFK